MILKLFKTIRPDCPNLVPLLSSELPGYCSIANGLKRESTQARSSLQATSSGAEAPTMAGVPHSRRMLVENIGVYKYRHCIWYSSLRRGANRSKLAVMESSKIKFNCEQQEGSQIFGECANVSSEQPE